MMKNIFSVILLVGIVAAAMAAVVPDKTVRKERPGFVFLGSVKKEVIEILNGVTSVTYQDWNYWLSANAAGYAEAARDCRENGDSLLEINSQDELDEVEAWLQDTDQTVSVAWVGGKYNSASKTLTWESGADILSDLWASGQPSQQKPNSRVAASIVGQIVQLKAQANTLSTRYICEGA